MLLLLKWPKNTAIIIYFFQTRSGISLWRTAITLKFKMRWFPNEACCWAEKLLTDIKLASLLPDDNKNFGSSLILDFRTSWRHVQAKNTSLRHSRLHHEPLKESIVTQDNAAFKMIVEFLYQRDNFICNLPQVCPVHTVECLREVNEIKKQRCVPL